jgi:hypothetical protein
MTRTHRQEQWQESRGKKDMSEFATEQTVAAQSLLARLRARAKKRPIRAVVEYALVLAFIAVLMLVALKFFQPAISNTLNTYEPAL